MRKRKKGGPTDVDGALWVVVQPHLTRRLGATMELGVQNRLLTATIHCSNIRPLTTDSTYVAAITTVKIIHDKAYSQYT